MPIFEIDDDHSDKEFRRQQKELNLKIYRNSLKSWGNAPSRFDGGDEWEDEIEETDSGN